MHTCLGNLFFAPKYLLALSLTISLVMSVMVVSQKARAEINGTATSTLEAFSVATSTSALTVTTTEATTTLSATTSVDILIPPLLETSATTTGEILEESTTINTEENPTEETPQPITADVPPPPALFVRKFTRHITLDSRAFHSCEADIFHVDVTGKASAQARITLHRDSDAPYEIEIGALPLGIDVIFSKNSAYRYVPGANDYSLDLAIINQPGSQKGNFSIPVVYTQKSIRDSSVICQLNIVNQ